MKTASSSLIIFQGAKLSMWSITNLCWCNWRTFWRINVTGRSPGGGSYSCTTMPHLTGHLQPRRNWPTWASSVLITHLFSESGPVGLPPCPWTEKNYWKVTIFGSMRRSLLPRRPGWTDELLNFFWVACRIKSNGLRSVLSVMGSMLNKSRVSSL
jgi:hypothetical protein